MRRTALLRRLLLASAVGFLGVVSAQKSASGRRCGPRGAEGVCIRLGDCPSALDRLNRQLAVDFCPESTLADPVACCGPQSAPLRGQSVSAQKCDDYKQALCPEFVGFVVGGEKALPGELSFMAAVGVGPSRSVTWMCGGSLISDRYVMSAAHCSKSTRGAPKWVRLGRSEIPLGTDVLLPEDYTIVEALLHPDYRFPASYNDIALYRLDREVRMGWLVAPICLPQPGAAAASSGDDVSAAGWGQTANNGPYSPSLMKVDLQRYALNTCSRLAGSKFAPRGLADTMICAGQLEGGKDTCRGDSGGPLYLPLTNRCPIRTQVGITSFGGICADPDSPAIYTDVLPFVPWIESVVWPTPTPTPSVPTPGGNEPWIWSD